MPTIRLWFLSSFLSSLNFIGFVCFVFSQTQLPSTECRHMLLLPFNQAHRWALSFEWRHKRKMSPQHKLRTKDAVANCACMWLILLLPHKCTSGINDRTVTSIFWTPNILIQSFTFAYTVFNKIDTYSWLHLSYLLRSFVNRSLHKIKQTNT